jgi:DedD protein
LGYTERAVENRVKERLTGAIILIAAMVILVPEMFSGQRKPATDPAAVAPHAASEGPPLRSYTMDLDTHGENGNARSANQASLGTAAPDPAAAAPAGNTTAPPAEPPRIATPQVAPAPAPQPAPPPARSEAAPSPAAPPAAAGDWYVQVGSFSKAANAQRYAREISARGFTTRVDPGKGKLLRVRVGPVADREAAQQLQGQLAARGYKGALTNP